jgi:hypothetical protein
MLPVIFPLVIQGAVAQLGERLHGMQEVVGSIPISSTNPFKMDILSVAKCLQKKGCGATMTCRLYS